MKHIQKSGETDFDELRINDSGHNESSKWVNGDGWRGWFSSVGARMSTVKLTMADTYRIAWWC